MWVAAKIEIELSHSAQDLLIWDGSAPIVQTVFLQISPIARGTWIVTLLFTKLALSSIKHALQGIALNNDGTVKNEGILSNLYKGQLGFIGQAINHRSEGLSVDVDGLQARVSQKIWIQFSSLVLIFVFRLGSTVTALRQLMLYQNFIKYLSQSTWLKENQMENVAHINQLTTNSNPLSQADNTGLPVGLRIYTKAKISTEYGSGSLTLINIKGRPGDRWMHHMCLNCCRFGDTIWHIHFSYIPSKSTISEILQSQRKHCHRIKRTYTL